MNKHLSTLCISVFLAFLILSCKNHINDSGIYESLNQTIIRSNQVIAEQSNLFYHHLEDKQNDPMTRVKALIWYPEAEEVKKSTADIIEYLSGLRGKLLQNLPFKKADDTYESEGAYVVKKIFIQDKEAETLYDRLENYKQKILNIDSLIKKEFDNRLQVFSLETNSALTREKFIQDYFTDVSLPASLAVLSQIQNNILIIENRLSSFCDQQVGITIDFIKVTLPLLSQNSKHFQPNEDMEVTAGIGAFIGSIQTISINDKNMQTNDSGFVRFKMKVPSKPGRYSIPISFTYLNQDFVTVTRQRKIRYTVDTLNRP
jgi:hypothetical protein